MSSAPITSLISMGLNVKLVFSGDRAQEIAAAVDDAWAWCLAPAAPLESVAIEVVLDDDPAVIATSHSRGAIAAADLRVVMHLLSQAVTVACIDALAGKAVMLHGCALANPETGRAIVAVAPSGTGKTTFVTTLGAGFAYLTDETVALRDDNSIDPYPKPLSVQSADNLKCQVNPERFGLRRPVGRPVLSALWFLDRSPDAVQPTFDPLSTLGAITLVAPQVSYLSALPTPLHRLARAIETSGGMTKVRYRDASDLSSHVDAALAGES